MAERDEAYAGADGVAGAAETIAPVATAATPGVAL